ncbi:class I SAM-dependent methyltransferase [Streptomyces sp. NBC_00289]|uniref:class I SAM-dependent methyltransferase n=1 Tax=Streptomyces sp. NBC_00289 TaxID=2975703 RepID=UPI00324B05CA
MSNAKEPIDYVLGRSEAETRRLIFQGTIYAPYTRAFLQAAGITRGMKVLDVGSGAGDVALLLADLVGPEGSVLGVDENPEVVKVARTRCATMGYGNVRFVEGDVRTVSLEKDFDAVTGRWILMYVPDSAALLRKAAGLVKPGGVVAFQEINLSSPPVSYPSTPLFERVLGYAVPRHGAERGPDTRAGLNLYSQYLEGGLPAPHLMMSTPMGGGPSWPGYHYLADTLRSLLPMLERQGAVIPEELDIDTLGGRLRDEAIGACAVQTLPPLIGAWSQRS